MKLLIAAACLAASLSLAGNALADGRTTATLEQAVVKATKPVAGGGVWSCDQDSCIAGYTPDSSFGVSQCNALARHVGRVVSFTDEQGHALQPAALERCNAGVTPKSPTVASAH